MVLFFEDLQKQAKQLETYDDVQSICEFEALKTIRPLLGYDGKIPSQFKNDGLNIINSWWGTKEGREHWERNSISKMIEEFELLFVRIGRIAGSDMTDPEIIFKKHIISISKWS